MSRDLDQRMRQALAAYQRCSTVAAASLAPSGGHSAPGTVEPAGETSAYRWRDTYLAATDDADRIRIIEHVERETHAVRKRQAPLTASETDEQRRRRIVRETAGWSPKDVAASRHAVPATTIRKWRIAAGLDPETGRREPRLLNRDEAAAEAVRLWNQGGMTRNQIAVVVGLHHEQVKRAIGDWRRRQDQEKAA